MRLDKADIDALPGLAEIVAVEKGHIHLPGELHHRFGLRRLIATANLIEIKNGCCAQPYGDAVSTHAIVRS